MTYDLDQQRDALQQIRAMAGFGKNARVAILDGAADPNHPDLRGLDIPVGSDDQPTLHGTAVTSLAVGRSTGIAPLAHVIQIPVFHENEAGQLQGCSQYTLARAIQAACDAGAQIINVSGAHLSNTGHPTDEMRAAAQRCTDENIQIVAAVGNDGLAVDTIPAAVDGVLAVAAHDIDGHAAHFNNTGPILTRKAIYAPGVDIRFAASEGAQAQISGSSFAAPVVAGLCALIRAQQLDLHNDDLQDLLFSSCVPCPPSHAGDANPDAARRLDFVLLHEQLSAISAGSVTPQTHVSKRNFPMSDAEDTMELVTPAGEVEPSAAVADIAPEPAVEPAELAPASADAQTEAPAPAARPTIQDPASNAFVHAPEQQVRPQHFRSNIMADEKVFAFGTIGYDFVNETNMDYFQQAMHDLGEREPNLKPLLPGNDISMARFLSYRDATGFQPNMDKSTALVWTLKVDGIPIYAIRPQSQFAVFEFSRLLTFLIQQSGIDPEAFTDTSRDTAKLMTEKTDDVTAVHKVDRVSIAGQIVGETRLYNGHVVPTVSPILRGMFSWNPSALATAAMPKNAKKAEVEGLRNFLERVYYELRNRGAEPHHRALNFAATNANEAKEVFVDAVKNDMVLNKIDVERSPISRPNSDFWDVVMEFFNPHKREEEARKLYRYTVDVAGLMPVTFGDMRSWRAY